MAFDKKEYHPKWTLIVYKIRKRSGNRCEGSPKFPDCRAINGDLHPVTGSTVVLTTGHYDHDKNNNRFSALEEGILRFSGTNNLFHWCQKCHLAHDIHEHVANRKYGKNWKKNQTRLDL